MKLEWQQNPPTKPMTWYEADEYVKSLGVGWRLPTRTELCDAYDNGVEGFKPLDYWSSGNYAQLTNLAWYVDFYNGNGHVYGDGNTSYYYVRCVREVSND